MLKYVRYVLLRFKVHSCSLRWSSNFCYCASEGSLLQLYCIHWLVSLFKIIALLKSQILRRNNIPLRHFPIFWLIWKISTANGWLKIFFLRNMLGSFLISWDIWHSWFWHHQLLFWKYMIFLNCLNTLWCTWKVCFNLRIRTEGI